jgi:hypothetical protein
MTSSGGALTGGGDHSRQLVSNTCSTILCDCLPDNRQCHNVDPACRRCPRPAESKHPPVTPRSRPRGSQHGAGHGQLRRADPAPQVSRGSGHQPVHLPSRRVNSALQQISAITGRVDINFVWADPKNSSIEIIAGRPTPRATVTLLAPTTHRFCCDPSLTQRILVEMRERATQTAHIPPQKILSPRPGKSSMERIPISADLGHREGVRMMGG